MPKNKEEDLSTSTKLIRIAGRLKELVIVKDEKGNILQKVIRPVMVEFYPRDMVQVAVGSAILAIPVAFTEEVWNLGVSLPLKNVLLISALSIFFIAIFVYYHSYKNQLKQHLWQYSKRVIVTYVFSMLIVGVLLTIVQIAPWQADWLVAVKRIILVAFPASLSATVVDTLK